MLNNESITDTVIRLTDRFKNAALSNDEQEVIDYIMSLSVARAAIVATRINQNLLLIRSDKAIPFAKLLENTANKLERNNKAPLIPYSYKGVYLGHHYEIGYNEQKDRFWYVIDQLISSGPIHYNKDIAEQMIKLEIDRRTR